MNYCQSCGKPIEMENLCEKCKLEKKYKRGKNPISKSDRLYKMLLYIMIIILVLFIIIISSVLITSSFYSHRIPKLLTATEICEQIETLNDFKQYTQLQITDIVYADNNHSFNAYLQAQKETDIAQIEETTLLSYTLEKGMWKLSEKRKYTQEINWIFDKKEWNYSDDTIECNLSFSSNGISHIVNYDFFKFDQQQLSLVSTGSRSFSTEENDKIEILLVSNDSDEVWLSINPDYLLLEVNGKAFHLS